MIAQNTTRPSLFIVAGLLGLACWLVPSPVNALPMSGLIGHWEADGNADDSSSLLNHGTFSGPYAPGHTGNPGDLAFDLAHDKVRIHDIPAYTLQNYPGWTVGFRFNTKGDALNGSNGTFLGQDVGPGEVPKWFIDYGYNFPGAFEIHLNNFGSNPRVFLPSNPVTLPAGWNQFTLVRQPGAFEFYLNGNFIGSQPYAGTIPDPTPDLTFGYQEPCCQFAGLLDDILIYDRALTAREVGDIVNPLGTVPDSAGTLSLLAFSLLALSSLRLRFKK